MENTTATSTPAAPFNTLAEFQQIFETCSGNQKLSVRIYTKSGEFQVGSFSKWDLLVNWVRQFFGLETAKHLDKNVLVDLQHKLVEEWNSNQGNLSNYSDHKIAQALAALKVLCTCAPFFTPLKEAIQDKIQEQRATAVRFFHEHEAQLTQEELENPSIEITQETPTSPRIKGALPETPIWKASIDLETLAKTTPTKSTHKPLSKELLNLLVLPNVSTTHSTLQHFLSDPIRLNRAHHHLLMIKEKIEKESPDSLEALTAKLTASQHELASLLDDLEKTGLSPKEIAGIKNKIQEIEKKEIGPLKSAIRNKANDDAETTQRQNTPSLLEQYKMTYDQFKATLNTVEKLLELCGEDEGPKSKSRSEHPHLLKEVLAKPCSKGVSFNDLIVQHFTDMKPISSEIFQDLCFQFDLKIHH